MLLLLDGGYMHVYHTVSVHGLLLWQLCPRVTRNFKVQNLV
jgi:hypothetical protein